ncbi:hypothetical protein ACRE_001140 [Hapsidospora chrysogenum ATCC 11550]|uniref:Uncharacterized protein n=1 Tax=Hapsidospora chrysogenum (strain ATCC 11550 / CBS 779.69 / DSM 880 / IAM 14645 / JCM 23072 / IMI 49137) TaxID=857340 RepID=A0A086TIA8_HAPC1|nr:hypothetical protein ACRE_001140 [Hapsidospora chrysogenum ATCC 11550]
MATTSSLFDRGRAPGRAKLGYELLMPNPPALAGPPDGPSYSYTPVATWFRDGPRFAVELGARLRTQWL